MSSPNQTLAILKENKINKEHLFGIEVSLTDNLLIGLFFTVVSIIRGYLVRRLFNWINFR